MRLVQIATILTVLIGILGCSSDESTTNVDQDESVQGAQIHPQAERFPHADVAPLNTADAEACNVSSVPTALGRLQMHLTGDDVRYALHHIPVNVPEDRTVRVASLNQDLVLILTTRPGLEELSAYHLPSDSAFQVADRGQGPGELLFPTDLTVRDAMLHVSMGDRRISTFHCEDASCAHRQDVRTEFQPTRITVDGDHFATTGMLPLQGETGLSALTGAIHRVDTTGAFIESFGEAYQTDAWMINERFTRHGDLTTFSDGAHAVQYDIIPRLYLYDPDDALSHVLEIDNFKQGTFSYENGTRSVMEDDAFSRILQLHAVGDRLAFMTVLTQRERSSETATNHTYDHYVVGTNPFCVSQLGKEDTADGAQSGRWVPTDHHLLRIEDGSVYLANLDER